MKKQTRFYGVETSLRIEDSGEKIVAGYASVFNQRSRMLAENGKVFTEIIMPGAFDYALSRNDLNVVAVTNHEKAKLLARTKSGTLNLSVDDYGLRYEFVLPDTTLGRDTAVMLERGDIAESSFKFWTRQNGIEWKRDDNGLLRVVHQIFKIGDVSLVVDGAYANTDVGISARELEEHEDTLVKAEQAERNLQLENYFKELKNNFYNE